MNTHDIEALEERLRAAMLASDVAALDQLISSRLMFVGPHGELISRDDDLHAHSSGTIKLSSIRVLERRVELLASFAVVTLTALLEGAFASVGFAGQFRYTRVWSCEDDVIKVVAGQVCPIQK